MTHIELKTTCKESGWTEGQMYVNGQYFCDTLEPPYKLLDCAADKLPNGTAIPEGNYHIVLSPSQKFRRSMPFLLSVPFFEGVMIHPGNVVADTRGCILVGKRTGPGVVSDSRTTFGTLMSHLTPILRLGNGVIITITRNTSPRYQGE